MNKSDSNVKRVTASEARAQLRSLRKAVLIEGQIIEICNHGDISGVLVSVSLAEKWGIKSDRKCSACQWREELTDYWVEIQTKYDAVWICWHNKPAIALISPKIWAIYKPS
jgi:PHD/YefM family antitoxin component YafN of YafNO toxin-antitoxin module